VNARGLAPPDCRFDRLGLYGLPATCVNQVLTWLDLDRRIENALETARIFEKESDNCFARLVVREARRM
jgi:hypothetical protein